MMVLLVRQILIVSDHSVTGEVLRYQIDDFVHEHPQYRDKIVQVIPRSEEHTSELQSR